ncbi:MAG TPA: extracellular solute-binding protein [Kribbella sp.]|uniref:extracellular solute-binding protein n=1 Tax=Kribbella sp. TaxID=1871183 RepID=UPI002D7878E2|nr:extracellular solute-binding protein [Kribbella sp.]HET6293891.1 extracellular solute-binding protein [Kribbella sp.]
MADFRSLRVAACCVALALVAACSSGGGAGETSGDTSGGQLTVWFPGTDPAESALVKDSLVPQFEKSTGAKVDVTYVDYANLSNKLAAAFAAGTAPDVFGHGPAAVADLVVNDRLEPLQADVDAMSQADRDDLAAALPGGQVDGKQYLMPLQMQGWVLAYNKDDFKAAGLDPENPPSTWEQLREDAKKLTVRDGSGKITRSGLLLATDPIGREQSFATLIASAGGSLIDTSAKTASFDSPQGQKALDYYVSLFNGPDAVATGLGTSFSANPPAQQPLVLGTASITLLAANGVQKVVKAYPGKHIGIIPPLKFEGADHGAAFGGAGPGLMINADSKAKELGWKFIDFMVGKDVNSQYVQSFGGIPVRGSAASSAYVTSSPVLTAVVKAAPEFVPNPNVAGWVQARDKMDANLEVALNRKASPQDVLKSMASDVNDVLKKSQ